LALANNGLNEVIVVSPILEKYIRNNYPKYKITSSTCKEIRDLDLLKEELEKDYSLVVLDYNWNNQFEVLETLPHKDKCEILVNACCQPNCQRRGEHYRTIGETQIKYVEHMNKHPNVPFKTDIFECDHTTSNIFDIMDYPTHVTPKDILEKYVPMGFENFKIEGRSFHLFNVVETYMYYMAKPEYRDEARFTLLLSLQQNGVISTHTIFD
jgi:collagenase-like PrtC family protease